MLRNSVKNTVERHMEECLRTGLKENPQVPLEETLLISAIADEARRQGGLKYPFEDYLHLMQTSVLYHITP